MQKKIDDIDALVDAINTGVSVYSLASMFNCARSTIRVYVNDLKETGRIPKDKFVGDVMPDNKCSFVAPIVREFDLKVGDLISIFDLEDRCQKTWKVISLNGDFFRCERKEKYGVIKESFLTKEYTHKLLNMRRM